MKNVQTITRFQIDEPNDLNDLNELVKTKIITATDTAYGKLYFLCRGDELEYAPAPESESEYDWYLYGADEYYATNGRPVEDFNLSEFYFEYTNDYLNG